MATSWFPFLDVAPRPAVASGYDRRVWWPKFTLVAIVALTSVGCSSSPEAEVCDQYSTVIEYMVSSGASEQTAQSMALDLVRAAERSGSDKLVEEAARLKPAVENGEFMAFRSALLNFGEYGCGITP